MKLLPSLLLIENLQKTFMSDTGSFSYISFTQPYKVKLMVK